MLLASSEGIYGHLSPHTRIWTLLVQFEVGARRLGAQAGGDAVGANLAPGVVIAVAFELEHLLCHIARGCGCGDCVFRVCRQIQVYLLVAIVNVMVRRDDSWLILIFCLTIDDVTFS